MYYNEKAEPLSGHLFLLDGVKWRRLRNKLSPAFTTGKMKRMYGNLVKIGEEFVDVLKNEVKQNPIVDVRDLLGRFTTDIITTTAFGIECNSLRNPQDKFHIYGRKANAELRHNSIVMSLIDSFPRLAYKLGMCILPEDVNQFFLGTVRQTVEYRQLHQIQRHDFLDVLIELKNESKGSDGLTIEEVAAQAFVFFLGGFETSSSTLTYTLYELAQNQEVQNRLREEVKEVFNQQDADHYSYEDLMNMTYMDQVLWETMRKYPIVPVLNRQALNDYTVPGHPKYVIEKGTPVFIPVLGIQHDPEFYPNPEVFDPERFSSEIVKQRDPMEWLPFGDGPRNCIGMHFGKMQLRLGLANFIRHFRVSMSDKTELPPLKFNPKALVLTPTNDILLKIEAI